MQRKVFCLCMELNPISSVVQPVTCHNANWAFQASMKSEVLNRCAMNFCQMHLNVLNRRMIIPIVPHAPKFQEPLEWYSEGNVLWRWDGDGTGSGSSPLLFGVRNLHTRLTESCYVSCVIRCISSGANAALKSISVLQSECTRWCCYLRDSVKCILNFLG